MTTELPVRARQLYRALLRELPRRHISLSSSSSSSTSPLKQQFRQQFERSSSSSSSSLQSTPSLYQKIQQAEQFVQYAKAQRMYATLVARYNPGVDMDQEERVRLSARRVGMNLPIENEYSPESSTEREIIENTSDFDDGKGGKRD